jgi:hypothetical protein
VKSVKVSSCGYHAGAHDPNSKNLHGGDYPETHSLDWYKAQGYELIDWDGQQAQCIIDRTGTCIAVLAGQPHGHKFTQACTDAYSAIQVESACTQFEHNQLDHKHSEFPAVNIGVSHGMGSTAPINLDTGQASGAAERLLQNNRLKCLSKFQDGEC